MRNSLYSLNENVNQRQKKVYRFLIVLQDCVLTLSLLDILFEEKLKLGVNQHNKFNTGLCA